MATRLYFSNFRASVAPAFSGAWSGTALASRYILNPFKDAMAVTVGSTIDLNALANRFELDRQYISPGLNGNQTISGLCSGQIMVREFATTDDVNQVRVCAKVVSNNGATVRGTLLNFANYGPTLEFINNASLRNKTIVSGNGNVSVGTINALDGDRIVVELGYNATAGGTTPQAAAGYGGGGRFAADLPIDETTTTSMAGWFDLGSVNLKFRRTQFTEMSDEEGLSFTS
jgi:hypothetical protein